MVKLLKTTRVQLKVILTWLADLKDEEWNRWVNTKSYENDNDLESQVDGIANAIDELNETIEGMTVNGEVIEWK